MKLKLGLSVLCLLSLSAFAAEYKGDYKKIGGDWTALNDAWCGGDVRVSCADGRNCELQVRDSKCTSISVYLEQKGDIFRSVDGTYTTKLIYTPLFFAERYTANVYIDLQRALTVDNGPITQWKNYWVNAVVSDARGNYEKVCPNFKARF